MSKKTQDDPVMQKVIEIYRFYSCLTLLQQDDDEKSLSAVSRHSQEIFANIKEFKQERKTETVAHYIKVAMDQLGGKDKDIDSVKKLAACTKHIIMQKLIRIPDVYLTNFGKLWLAAFSASEPDSPPYFLSQRDIDYCRILQAKLLVSKIENEEEKVTALMRLIIYRYKAASTVDFLLQELISKENYHLCVIAGPMALKSGLVTSSRKIIILMAHSYDKLYEKHGQQDYLQKRDEYRKMIADMSIDSTWSDQERDLHATWCFSTALCVGNTGFEETKTLTQTKFLEYLQKAKSNNEAKLILAQCLLSGMLVEKSVDKAITLLTELANVGHRRGILILTSIPDFYETNEKVALNYLENIIKEEKNLPPNTENRKNGTVLYFAGSFACRLFLTAEKEELKALYQKKARTYLGDFPSFIHLIIEDAYFVNGAKEICKNFLKFHEIVAAPIQEDAGTILNAFIPEVEADEYRGLVFGKMVSSRLLINTPTDFSRWYSNVKIKALLQSMLNHSQCFALSSNALMMLRILKKLQIYPHQPLVKDILNSLTQQLVGEFYALKLSDVSAAIHLIATIGVIPERDFENHVRLLCFGLRKGLSGSNIEHRGIACLFFYNLMLIHHSANRPDCIIAGDIAKIARNIAQFLIDSRGSFYKRDYEQVKRASVYFLRQKLRVDKAPFATLMDALNSLAARDFAEEKPSFSYHQTLFFKEVVRYCPDTQYEYKLEAKVRGKPLTRSVDMFIPNPNKEGCGVIVEYDGFASHGQFTLEGKIFPNPKTALRNSDVILHSGHDQVFVWNVELGFPGFEKEPSVSNRVAWFRFLQEKFKDYFPLHSFLFYYKFEESWLAQEQWRQKPSVASFLTYHDILAHLIWRILPGTTAEKHHAIEKSEAKQLLSWLRKYPENLFEQVFSSANKEYGL